MTPTIGWIGQGWIGKNFADDFEERGYVVVRYALEEPYAQNRDAIGTCDIVFIAVPTPTTPERGFDASIVEEVLGLVGVEKIAVIKSTVLPGTTNRLQERYADRFVMHAPEFLTAKNAAHDVRHPQRNIVGVTERSRPLADRVMTVLPHAPMTAVVTATEAEMTKYVGNGFLTMKVLFMNAMYDLCVAHGIDYAQVAALVGKDPRIGSSHLSVVHEGGRGAGGYCFVKDFAALRQWCTATYPNRDVEAFLAVAERYNRSLLEASGKSEPFLQGVYGDDRVTTE